MVHTVHAVYTSRLQHCRPPRHSGVGAGYWTRSCALGTKRPLSRSKPSNISSTIGCCTGSDGASVRMFSCAARVERRVDGKEGACYVRAVCVRCACGAHAHAVHGPRAILPNTNTHTRLRHVGELCARPVARVGQHVVEGLVAAVLKGVNVHRAHPRLGRGGSGNGVGGWIRAEGLRLAFRA